MMLYSYPAWVKCRETLEFLKVVVIVDARARKKKAQWLVYSKEAAECVGVQGNSGGNWQPVLASSNV